MLLLIWGISIWAFYTLLYDRYVLEDRAYLLSALGCVDGVVLFDEDTPFQLLETIRPNILVKGGDYKVDEVIGREFVDSVQILSFKDGYSTTNVVNKIANLVEDNKL